METKKKLSDYDATSESPFVVELQGAYIQPDPEHKTMQGDDGKLYGMYEIPKGRTRVVDRANYTKLFKGSTSTLLNMSEPSTRMLYYIIENIVVHKDEVCILQEDYLKYAGYKAKSRLTYYRAVEGLLKANVIARRTGMGSCYWVNPNILFNGDRTKLSNITVKPVDSGRKPFKFNREEE